MEQYRVMENLAIIILAAGKGTRMRSSQCKVLQPLAGRPWLLHLFETTEKLQPQATLTIISPNHKVQMQAALAQQDCIFIEQKQALGTAHAVLQALPQVQAQRVLILVGDVPLLTAQTLTELIEQTPADAVGMLTCEPDNPAGLGRVLRNDEADIIRVVEEKDATNAQKTIREVAAGIYIAPTQLLKTFLPQINNDNASGEYYLPDIIPLSIEAGVKVKGVKVQDAMQTFGINTKNQLAKAERYYQLRLLETYMQNGLTLIDPARVDIRGQLSVEKDVIFDINVIIEGEVSIGKGCSIGPNTVIRNAQIGDHVIIHANSIIEDAIIENNCQLGPFARVRPGCHLKDHAKVGNFVELKNAQIGKGSKVNHLSYVGDAQVEKHVNIGAGTITCNYDGAHKHQTVIKSGAFIGSNTALVAPITVGENATVGAGSVLTKDAPDEQLTLSRAKQTSIENWDRKE